jgi:hypothetical protein
VLISVGTYSAKIGTAIDESELKLLIDSGSPAIITADDIMRDIWNGAVVDIGFCDWSDVSLGGYRHRRYEIASGVIDAGVVTFELRGPEHRLERNVAVPLTVNCRHDLGDSRCLVELDAEEWAGNTEYAGAATEVIRDSARAVVKPSTANGFWFRALVGGTSDTGSPPTEPTWPTTLGGTVTDNEVTWEAILARRQQGAVDSVTTSRQFTSADIHAVDDFYGEGFLEWLTGDNAGMRQRIRAHTLSGSPAVATITLYDSAFDGITVGDTFEIVAGCRKRPADDCFTKFRNRWNVGAFSHLADEGVTTRAAKGSA